MYVYACVYVRVRTSVRACVRACVRMCMSACVYVRARVLMCSLTSEFMFDTDNLSRSDGARDRRDGLAGEDVDASVGIPLRR